ncbi:MAG: restriction endonuclease subunit S [Pseudobutyrivibrio sp.]|nr:restriction endonuclease subunit S [Pseudobutyrivibrio sp.]
MKAIMRDKAELRDSGIEWIGDIPENWTLSKIKYHVSGYKAGPFGSSLITSKLDHDGELLVYTPEHVAKKSTNIDGNLYLPINRKEEMSQFLVSSGDVVFPIVGSLGRAMQIEDNMPNGIINQRLAKFCISESNIIPSYFMWLFGKSTFYETYIELFSRGSIIVNLTKQIVGNMPLPLPSVIEQQDIIKYLDDRCSKIDTIIAEAKASIEEYKELKQAVIYEAVTKGLDKNVEMKDSGIEWIGKIPKSWGTPHLSQIAYIYSGGTPNRNHPEYWNGNIPWLKTGELKNNEIFSAEEFITQDGLDNSSAIIFPENTILMAMYGQGKTRGMTAILKTPCATNQACAGILLFNDKIETDFLWICLMGAYNAIRQKAVGAGQPNLSLQLIGSFKVTMPSLAEQKSIVEYVKNKNILFEEVISEKQSLIEDLESYKKSLIYEVVTGKRKVVE